MSGRRIALIALAGLLLVMAAGGSIYGARWWKQHQADAAPLEYQDYVRLGRLKMSDPVYRMGSMIELRCAVTDDFLITRGEEKRILTLAAKLKRKPEPVESPLMQTCIEWEKKIGRPIQRYREDRQ